MAKVKKVVLRGKSFDETQLGLEPDFTRTTFKSEKTRKLELLRTLHWYGYFSDVKTDSPFLIKYLKQSDHKILKEENKSAIKKLASPRKDIVNPTALKLCRMALRGWELDSKELAMIDSACVELLNAIELVEEETDTTPKPKVVSPTMRSIARCNETILGDLEDMIDSWMVSKNPQPIDVYELMKEYELKGPMPAKLVTDWLQAYGVEMASLLTDKELAEAYGDIPKHTIKKRLKAIETMHDAINAVKEAAKAKRKKPSKSRSKTVTLDKLVEKVKYKIEDNELKLVSIDPSKIVGSSAVLLYNTKYNIFSMFVTEDKGGLSIKGTSIIQYDPVASVKVRTPSKVIGEVMKKTVRQVTKVIEDLRGTAEPVPSGQIGSETLILKAFK